MALLLHLLLFSSDERAAHVLTEMFAGFDIEVECCSDILRAVERLTTGNFQALLADWDDGQEAVFLIKAARELKSTQDCVALAWVRDAAGATCAVQIGAHGTLSKPIVQAEVSETVVTLHNLLAYRGSPKARQSYIAPVQRPAAPQSSLDSPRMPQRQEPAVASHAPSRSAASAMPSPRHDTEKAQGRNMGPVYTGPLFSSLPYMENSRPGRHAKSKSLAILSFLFLASATLYIRAPQSAYGVKLASIIISLLDRTAAHQTETYLLALSAPVESNIEQHRVARRTSRNYMSPIATASADRALADEQNNPSAAWATTAALPAAYQPFSGDVSATPLRVPVPDSLRVPVSSPGGRVGGMAPVVPSSLLRPVVVSEEAARKLLLVAHPPLYPETALQDGLQGLVVLQALIARDGTISDLKLVRGHWALARAAFEAVRLWRFKPYSINGQPAEAATLLTINFKLPPLQAEKHSPHPVNAAQARF